MTNSGVSLGNPDLITGETMKKYEEFVNPALARLFRFMGLGSVGLQSNGMYIQDVSGREFLDCLGNFGVFSLGHRHPRVVAAVKEQLERMPQTARYLLDKPMADLADLLADITPGSLKYSFFCNSGTEAVEGAIKLARLHKKKPGIIATTNGFHGKTLGALSATGRDIFRMPCEPLLPHFKFVPFGDADALDQAIDEHTAAFIVEPIQGEGGINLPPDDYLTRVREICDERDIILIFDEVQTGFGRTGKMFACEHWGVVPDMMTFAKALGGGVMPIGAFTAKPELWETFIEHPFIHTSTFGGNPLACAAGVATIQVLREENLVADAAAKGEYFLGKLRQLQQDYPEVIAEVRGKGLLIGIELRKEGIGGLFIGDMVDNNIIAAYTLNNPKVIRMEPPLIITREQIDYVLHVLRQAAAKAQELLEDL